MQYVRLVLACLAATLLSVLPLAAQAPNTLSYQGLLTTALGTPVPDGLYKLQFDLFASSSGGVSIWTEVDSQISVQRGTFSQILGSGTALPDSFHYQLYLEVTALSGPSIGSPTKFSPRSPLASAPSALGLKTPVIIADSILAPLITVYNKFPFGNLLHAHSSNGFGIESTTPYMGLAGSTVNTFYYALPGTGTSGYGSAGAGVLGVTDSGTGIYGFSNSPAGLAGLFFGKVRVQTAAGDSAVQLPDNSISAHEILDEPGISQGIILGTGPTLGTNSASMTDIDSTTITTPAAGYIVVEASGQAALSASASNIDYCQIDETPRAFVNGNYEFNVGFSSGPTATAYLPITMRRTFYKNAGTYTFFFEGYNSGGGSYVWDPVITAMYFPTGYGSVNAVVPPSEASSFEHAQQVSSLPPSQQGVSGSGAAAIVDLRELELKAEKLRKEREQVEEQIRKAKEEIRQAPH